LQLSVKSSELCAVEGEKARVEKRLAEKDRELEEVLKKGFCEETANATTDSIMDAEIARLTHKTNEQARCEEINAICNEYKRDAEVRDDNGLRLSGLNCLLLASRELSFVM
uniref:Uncharacterized protein n=1 Tax=Parascaris equorum TaxID=6256 RepID=A0A914S641_PAREQ